MSLTSRVRLLYLSHFSQPPSDRPIYRAILNQRVRTIVELGIGTGDRALRMIEAAAGHGPVAQVRYTGIDPFEGRSCSDGPGMTLKAAHRMIRRTGAQVRLLPGDLQVVLSGAANTLTGTDLVVLSPREHAGMTPATWFYLPRMLHQGSLVFAASSLPDRGQIMVSLSKADINRLAGGIAPRPAQLRPAA